MLVLRGPGLLCVDISLNIITYLFILVAVNTYLRMHILTGPAVPMVGTRLIATGAGSASTVTKTN
jgi:hypothetical protein